MSSTVPYGLQVFNDLCLLAGQNYFFSCPEDGTGCH